MKLYNLNVKLLKDELNMTKKEVRKFLASHKQPLKNFDDTDDIIQYVQSYRTIRGPLKNLLNMNEDEAIQKIKEYNDNNPDNFINPYIIGHIIKNYQKYDKLEIENKKLKTKLKVKNNKNKTIKQQLKDVKKNLKLNLQRKNIDIKNEMKKIKELKEKKHKQLYNKEDKFNNYKIKNISVKVSLWTRLEKKEDANLNYAIHLDSKGLYYQIRYADAYYNVSCPYDIINKFKGKYTYDYNNNWDQLINILKTNETFKHVNENNETYVNMIIVHQVYNFLRRDIEDVPLFKKYLPKFEELHREQTEWAIYHKYIDYSIDENAKSFNEMFNIPLEKYTQDNYKANSCFLNILVDTYHKAFSNSKHYAFNGTYDDFIKLLDLEIRVDDIGLSINKSLKFFQKFSLGLCAIGPLGIIELYKPETRNKNISPNTLYILVTNGHCYKLNNNLDSFSKKIWVSDEVIKEEFNKKITKAKTSQFIIRDTKNVNYNVKYITSLDEIVQYIKNTQDDAEEKKNNKIEEENEDIEEEDKDILDVIEEEEKNKIEEMTMKFIYNNDLSKLIRDMVFNKFSYIPQINFIDHKIVSISFKITDIDGVVINGYITSSYEKDSLEKSIFLSPQIYENFHLADDELYSNLFTKENMSYYNPQYLEIANKYKMIPMTGKFYEKTELKREYYGLDANLAYTSDFCDIEYYPVFNYFDIFQKYDGHKIEDYTQYIVKCESYAKEDVILFPNVYNRCWGLKLNKIFDVEYEILAFCRPSKLNESNSKELINNLWSKTLDPNNAKQDRQMKKDIFNMQSGTLEKKNLTSSFTKVFKDINECTYYQSIFGGNIHVIGEDEQTVDLYSKIFASKSDDKNNDAFYEKKIFILNVEEKRTLESGFCPIKELIYDIRSLKNWQIVKKLHSRNIPVVGLKTDCCLFQKKFIDTVNELFEIDPKKIGCFKIETGKSLPSTVIHKVYNDKPIIKKISVTEHMMINERDINESNEIIKKNNTLILGLFAGVGKTYTASQYICKKKLFVTPFNTLAIELKKQEYEAITLNNLLGIGISCEKNTKMTSFNVKDYDCIIFDEIFIYSPKELYLISKYINSHPNIRFIATGDNKQNAPIELGNYNNIGNEINYLNNCINQIFNNHLLLKVNKRLEKKEDIDKLTELKKDIFNLDLDVIDTFKKHKINLIYNYGQLKTKKNICFFNNNCHYVNNHVHNKLVQKPKDIEYIIFDGNKYYEGLEIIFNGKYYRNKNIRLFQRYTYVIKSINNNHFIITEPLENIDIKLNIKLLKKFTLPYSYTCHSVQGLTWKDPYTIFNCNTPYVNRRWIYTALTRTDDLNKVTIFVHSDKEIEILREYKLKQYFGMKINNYKKQDKKANRIIDERRYINFDWIEEKFETLQGCYICKKPFEFNVVDAKITSNLTVDRLNNNEAHHKSNCKLCCLNCNVTKK